MEPYFVIALLFGAVVLFATEKISVDLVTLGLLSVLVVSGILNVQEAFAGFGNEVIIMLGSIFIVGAALRDTGVLDSLGNLLAKTTGGHPKWVAAAMTGSVGTISAFMNNTTVTAMFLGPVVGMARRLKISPSRLLMPLSFASILGGTCTLIGTSTNVAVSGALKQRGLEEIGMFDITPLGVILFGAGLVYLLLIGMRWVPERDRADTDPQAAQMREYLSEVVVLPGSPLIGQRAFDSDFSVLEFQVVKLTRRDVDLPVGPHTEFQEGDVVQVAGKVQNLIKIKKIEGIDIREDVQLRRSGVDTSDVSVAEVVLTPRSNLVGQTLRSSNFRRKTGLSVLALLRGDRTLNDHMADVVLHAGDLLLLQGPFDRFHKFEQEAEMVVISEHNNYSTAARKRGVALLAAFALAVTASSLGWLPASVAFLLTALVALATRCISLDTAYENIDWRLLILIGGMTAFGTAMANSGADTVLASFVHNLLSDYGPVTVMGGFCLLTMLLTQPMSNAAAALVVLPVALQTAEQMEVSQRAFGIAIMLSASISVLTPFEPSCILVYGPGKYRFGDFIKVGSGLTLLSLILILLLVPVFWPLK